MMMMNSPRSMTVWWCSVLLVTGLVGCQTPRSYHEPPEPQAILEPEPTDDQTTRLAAAEAAQEAGDYEQALRLFQEILGENPTITSAYLGIGEIHLVRNDYERAEPAFARAARLEPQNFDAQYGHGLALQMLNRLAEAVRAYQRALTIRPDDVDANLNLATVYLQLDDPERALIFARNAVEHGPASGPAHANLGAIYERLDRNAEAIDAYLAAVELMGNESQLLMNLINVLSREKRYQEAVNTAETLARLDPSPDVYERLGWCYFKLRVYFKSLQAYESAVALDPGYWPAWNGIGVNALNDWLLGKRRDLEAKIRARDAFRHSLRLNPKQKKVVKLMLNYSLG